jgi:hypothetical protein
MSWDRFVLSTLDDLHEGSEVPHYFGCLIPFISHPLHSVLVQPPPSSTLVDDLLPAVEPSQAKTFIEEEEEEEPSLHTELLVRPEPEEDVSEPPKRHSRSSITFPRTPSRSPRVDQSQTPKSVDYPEQTVDEVEEDIEEDEVNQPEPVQSLADEFQRLGNEVFDRYWPETESTIPRLRRDSLIMVTFKASKYNRLKQTMQQRFAAKEQQTQPNLTFVRVF